MTWIIAGYHFGAHNQSARYLQRVVPHCLSHCVAHRNDVDDLFRNYGGLVFNELHRRSSF